MWDAGLPVRHTYGSFGLKEQEETVISDFHLLVMDAVDFHVW